MVIKNQILRLDVSVDYAIVVYILQPLDDTGSEELGLFLREPPVSADMIPQITSCLQIHDQIQILSILKSILHVDDVAKQSNQSRHTYCIILLADFSHLKQNELTFLRLFFF